MGEAPNADGSNEIEFGDGYHNYLLAGFVSCYHNNIIPAGRKVLGAQLNLKANRIFGGNPFSVDPTVTLRVDMVGNSQQNHDSVVDAHDRVLLMQTTPTVSSLFR